MKKFNIILDEYKFAEEVLDGNHKYLGVNLSAKYIVRYKYKDFVSEGKVDETKLYEYVMDFLLTVFTKDEIIKNIPTIKKSIIKYSNSNFDLKTCKGLIITKKELDAISGLNNNHLEILAFSILVIKKIENFKLNKSGNFFKLEFKDYYKEMTDDKGDMKRQNQSIKKLCENGLITLPSINDMGKNKGFSLNYIDFSEEAEILISDLREIPLIYKRWKGEGIIECEWCGRLIKVTTSNNKYCKSCASEREKQRKREKKWESSEANDSQKR